MSLALDLTAAELEEGEMVVASVVKESLGKLERPIMLSVITSEGTAEGKCTCMVAFLIFQLHVHISVHVHVQEYQCAKTALHQCLHFIMSACAPRC